MATALNFKHAVAAAAMALALAAGIAVTALPGSDGNRSRGSLGLLTSLPIYWGEAADIGEALNGSAAPHWARAALEADYRLMPLDTLDGDELRALDRLILAQPRPLTPGENVALDNWVRGGGKLLLFADPMLTEHSRFALGDRRRPQDVALLSPILRRWGLEMQFDADQEDGERAIRLQDRSIPVRLSGAFYLKPSGAADCALLAESVVAHCVIGKGTALIVADAAILESERDPHQAAPALAHLVGRAFPD